MVEPTVEGSSISSFQLVHRELIRPVPQKVYSHNERPDMNHCLVALNEIPVHSLVSQTPFAFNPDFVQEVMGKVPASINQDLEAMKAVLGHDFDLELDNEGIGIKNDQLFRRALFRYFRPNGEIETQTVSLSTLDPSITLSVLNPRVARFFIPEEHPMPVEKLKHYVADNRGIRTWYGHNAYDGGLPTFMVLRNFAIQFNNSVLQKLAK